MAQDEQDSIKIQGELSGHNDWITCLATAADSPNMLLTGSRDKSIIVWELETKRSEDQRNEQQGVEKTEICGTPKTRLKGHNHFVSDIAVSSDKQYALSSSWDGTLRLWNLKTGETTKRFVGHKKDVLSVAFSADNTRIVSGSRDHNINIWNTIGILQDELRENSDANRSGHSDWVTCCRVSPSVEDPVIVSCGRDGLVKVWNTRQGGEYRCKNLKNHTSYVNSVTVSPDGSLCASGGKDGLAILWDLNEGKMLSSLKAEGEIMALCFSPNRYWLCGAVVEFGNHDSYIKIWDLETKEEIGKLKVEYPEAQEDQEKRKKKKKRRNPVCTCLTWSHDGKTLFAGYTDKKVRIWSLISGAQNELQVE